MRELRASVRAGKTIVTVRETEAGKGAMSDEEVELVECGPPRDEEACDVDEICWYQNQQDKSNNSTMYCQPQVFVARRPVEGSSDGIQRRHAQRIPFLGAVDADAQHAIAVRCFDG